MIEIIDGEPECIEDNLRIASANMTQFWNYSGKTLFDQYIKWANSQVRMFAGLISARDVGELFQTRGYWSLRSSDPSSLGDNLTATVQREMEWQKHAIEVAADELRDERKRWHGQAKSPIALILDTGVVEAFADQLLEADWHKLADVRPHHFLYLVVPRVVLDELDRHKQSRDNGAQSKARRMKARAAIKSLWAMFGAKNKFPTFCREYKIPAEQGAFELLSDDINHAQLSDPDAELLARSRTLTAFLPVKVVTFDTGMALRGMASGIDVVLASAPDDEDEQSLGPGMEKGP